MRTIKIHDRVFQENELDGFDPIRFKYPCYRMEVSRNFKDDSNFKFTVKYNLIESYFTYIEHDHPNIVDNIDMLNDMVDDGLESDVFTIIYLNLNSIF